MTQPIEPNVLDVTTTATTSTEPVVILNLLSVLGQAVVVLLGVLSIVVAPALLPAILGVVAALIPIIQVVASLIARSKVIPVSKVCVPGH